MSTDLGLRRAIFLDRDGVINRMVYNPDFGLVDSPHNPDQFSLLPGVSEAIKMINEMGYLAVVVSNQPGIAKGKLSPMLLDLVTEKMYGLLADDGARIDATYYCLHHPEAFLEEYRAICDCRKPKPGLLMKAVRQLGIDPRASYMIGDGLTDVLAGKAMGCTTVFLGGHKCDVCGIMDELGAKPSFFATDLLEVVKLVRHSLVSQQLNQVAR